MSRKTVDIKFLVDTANYFLKNTSDERRTERLATAAFLETALVQADQYAGYNYLASAGVDHDSERVDIKDDSRRVYFIKNL